MRIRSLAPLVLTAASTSCSALDFGDSVGGLVKSDTPAPADSAPALPAANIVQVLTERDLTSNQMAVADYRDPNLVNGWGLSFGPDGAAWVSDNGSGLASSYNAKGGLGLTVVIPGPVGGAPSTPTGQVFNGDTGSFTGDTFIFVTEDGTIAGWQPSFAGAAQLRVDNSESGAVYKGIALARSDRDLRLFAADFRHGRIDVFSSSYQPVTLPDGSFVDGDLPPDYAPFNVVAADDLLFVTYAEQQLPDKTDEVNGPGKGFIDLFDPTGHLQKRLASRGTLDSPWGLAIAPPQFGLIPGTMLVGNFGDGRIGVYTLSLGAFQLQADFAGFVGTAAGSALSIDGLWGLAFPPPLGGFNPQDLYFTAGPGQEKNGLFGRLTLP